MIFIQPIELAGEFIQHQVTIVLTGIVLVELFTNVLPKNAHRIGDMERVRLFLGEKKMLLGVAALSAFWFMSAYFLEQGDFAPWYHFGFEPILLAAILFLVIRLMMIQGLHAQRFLSWSIIGLIFLGHITCSVYFFTDWRAWQTISICSMTASAIVLYLFVMRSLISLDKQ